ncbi:NAD(P)H-dependent oxidoreductase [Thermocoleostomius sinensis]|uniref:NAD(P)H-dependent oxidoreductase n=1 Tax=Thermocoleostomius sinensis A174 TaxID=2016057 RepID=A0A9E8ZGK9_9CYAN|nr:NAD(P)H-dependent oxidoreductase [Thermocoleostomius sinensis]WAL62773.1 NAD(P)H-dependent oxidoreductase [Thermocoleostomius sinensis A174]
MQSSIANPTEVLQQLHWRYATKKFDSTRKIPDDVWQTLEQSLVLAPSSFGLQPWKFFVVTNPNLRQQLVEPAWGQTQVVDASHLVVFTIKKDVNTADVDRYIARMAEVQQTSIDALEGLSNMIKGFLSEPPFPLDVNEWSKRQAYIALGQFMTCAAMLGIDTCPMEGFIPAKYDEILGFAEQGYTSVVLCPAGYRAEDDRAAARPKVRYETQDVLQYI